MPEPTPLAELHKDLKQLLVAGEPFTSEPHLVPEARRIAASAAAPGGTRGRERVMALLRPVRRRALYLSRALVRRTPRQASALARLTDVIRAFRDEALPRLGEDAADVLGEAESDLAWSRRLLARHPEEKAVLEGLSDRVDDTLVQKLRRRMEEPDALDRPGFVLARLMGTEVDLVDRGQVAQAARLEAARASLWDRIDAAAAARGPGAARWLDDLFDDVADKGADALAQVESLELGTGRHLLAVAHRDLERARSLAVRSGVRGRRRELARMQRRLAAALQDRDVRLRQVALVGRRGLRAIEVSILLLILGVMVILGWLVLGDPSPGTRWTLAWIDAAICAALLAEFGWRLGLARRRGIYFLRYFLTDVLPSLPFGLISESILAAHGVTGGDKAGSLRILRASRLLRGLRLIRPLMQAFRLTAFAVQGMDRMVRRYGDLLNRNVVLFDRDRDRGHEAEDLGDGLRRLDRRLTRALRLSLAAQDPDVVEVALLRRAEASTQRLDGAPVLEVHLRRRTRGDLRDVRMERLIDALLEIDAEAVEDRLGEEGARRMARFLGIFDIPGVRRLPVLRHVVPGLARLDPYDALTTAGQRLGLYLDAHMDRLRFLGDLTGIITGPQLLDRAGATLVRMTQRPAVRLLLLGFLMLLVSGLVSLVGDPPRATEEHRLLLEQVDATLSQHPGGPEATAFLRERLVEALEEAPGATAEKSLLWSMHTFFRKVLGTPLIVLGSICLVIQAFGRWIRRLAGEASDRFQKVAEAQGINLLKFEKLGHRREDLDLLFDRALGPEVALRGRRPEVEAERGSFREQLPHRPGEPVTFPEVGGARTQVMMLYQDYLDGAILHRSNIKSTEQFLGNLDIEAVRRGRLPFAREEKKALARLDITRDRPLPTGPYLWFRFITESLAEKTAKLVLEYNRMAIPEGHRGLIGARRLEESRQWVARELPLTSLRRTNQRLLEGSILASTHFNALHFMSADPRRDAAVAAEFGPEVLARLRDDRQTMIREVFGTYPFENLPRARRTFNPYNLYFDHLGGGRALLLPLRVAGAAVVATGRGLRGFARLVREQLHPEIYRRDPRARWASFAVAVRKLNRMARPIFMAALDLRSRFDPEFLGAALPGRAPVPEGEDQLSRDLDLIGAREHERERYHRRREDTLTAVQQLEEFLRSRGWPERGVILALDPEGEDDPVAGAEREALRAVLLAWQVDYRGCRSLLLGEDRVTAAFRRILNDPGDLVPRRIGRARRHRRRLFLGFLARGPFRETGEEERRILWAAFMANRQQVRSQLVALEAAGGPEAARRDALRTLALVARYPNPWSRQLVTLRTVQAVTILDILNSRRLVHDLGRYGSDPPPRPGTLGPPAHAA